MKRRYLLILLILVGLLAACGPAEEPEEAGVEDTFTVAAEEDADVLNEIAEDDAVLLEEADDGAALEEAGPPPDFEGLDYTTTESGLQYVITEEGTGEQPEAGDIVLVNYTGQLGDGTVFDTSLNRGEPFRFPLGQGAVIPGWDEGIALLQEGGQAKLVIPSDLAYGPAGAGGTIPPDATLYFDVELVEVQEGGPQTPAEVAEGDYEETESGLRYYVLEEGTGEMAEEGEVVRVDFTAWLDDGTRLDSSLDVGQPLSFILGDEQMFAGLNEGVAMMEVGEKRQLVIPPDLGFGEQGAGGTIPPNATLIFEVELLEVLPAPPEEPEEVDEDEFTTTESGLQYAVLQEGSGAEVVAGQPVTVQYTGWLAEEGTRFDTSYARGEPFTFVAGAGQVIPGWDEGVVGMQVGEKRQLVIPPDLAYGEQGAGGVIPPSATLIFEVEVLEIPEG